MPLPRVEIYTDGSCINKKGGGPGAYTYIILLHDEDLKGPIRLPDETYAWEVTGVSDHTTSNRMELTAAIEALRALEQKHIVRLYTDSLYLQLGASKWMSEWQKNGWKTKSGAPVANLSMWQRIAHLVTLHDVTWVHVRGHSGDKWNERADSLAAARLAELGNLKE